MRRSTRGRCRLCMPFGRRRRCTGWSLVRTLGSIRGSMAASGPTPTWRTITSGGPAGRLVITIIVLSNVRLESMLSRAVRVFWLARAPRRLGLGEQTLMHHVFLPLWFMTRVKGVGEWEFGGESIVMGLALGEAGTRGSTGGKKCGLCTFFGRWRRRAGGMQAGFPGVRRWML